MILALMVGLTSCKPAALSSDEQQVTEAETLDIVTTLIPMTQFTKAVVGDRGQVEQLLPPESGAHHYEGTPRDVQMLAKADVLVKNGLEMEFFLDELLANADNPELTVINSSQEISALSWDDTEAVPNSSHDKNDGDYDPHVWLDPKRAIQQVKNIRDGLIKVDPEGEQIYRKNAQAYIEDLQQLDQQISEQLSPYQGETFVVFHDFANYFADSYHLDSQSLVEMPAEEPSPQKVQQVMETVEQNKIQAILTEPQAEGAFDVLSKDLGVRVSYFDPLATGDGNSLQPEDYLTTMRQNAENLLEAFEGSPRAQQAPTEREAGK